MLDRDDALMEDYSRFGGSKFFKRANDALKRSFHAALKVAVQNGHIQEGTELGFRVEAHCVGFCTRSIELDSGAQYFVRNPLQVA